MYANYMLIFLHFKICLKHILKMRAYAGKSSLIDQSPILTKSNTPFALKQKEFHDQLSRDTLSEVRMGRGVLSP